jgi:hypothetical protein
VTELSGKTTIAVSKETVELLKQQGAYADTMDRIVRRLLEQNKPK